MTTAQVIAGFARRPAAEQIEHIDEMLRAETYDPQPHVGPAEIALLKRRRLELLKGMK